MDTFKTIQTRKSVRTYLPNPVSDSDINKIVAAGNMASCSAKLYITVITNKAVLDAINEETKKVFLNSGSSMLVQMATRPSFHALYKAPVLIVISAVKGNTGMLAVNNIASAGCAAQNMMLAATDLNLGTCYMYGPSRAFENPNILKMADMDSDTEALACVILGHTTDVAPHAPRAPATNIRYCK